MFKFEIDPRCKLIRSWFEGFLSVADVMEWSRQEQDIVVALGCRSGEFLLLIDTQRCAIQSQEVVAAFQKIIVSSRYKARRIALVQGGSLTRMQTRRIALGTDHIRHFDETADAETWLFETSDIAMSARIARRF